MFLAMFHELFVGEFAHFAILAAVLAVDMFIVRKVLALLRKLLGKHTVQEGGKKAGFVAGLVAQWKDESRRMKEAEEAADQEEAEEVEAVDVGEEDEECEEEDECGENPSAVCALCGVSADSSDDEDGAFYEKELSRLRKVHNGLRLKRERMLYVYRANDTTLTEDARRAAMAKLEATKAWRGLMFDMKYVEDEIEGLSAFIEREN